MRQDARDLSVQPLEAIEQASERAAYTFLAQAVTATPSFSHFSGLRVRALHSKKAALYSMQALPRTLLMASRAGLWSVPVGLGSFTDAHLLASSTAPLLKLPSFSTSTAARLP